MATFAVLALAGLARAGGGVLPSPLSSVDVPSKAFAVTVDGVSVPVVAYSGDYDYATADLSDATADVRVTRLDGKPIEAPKVSPLKLGLKPTVAGAELRFTIKEPQYLIIKAGQGRKLVLALDAPETDQPKPTDENVFDVTGAPFHADNTGRQPATTSLQAALKAAAQAAHGSARPGVVFVPAGVYRATQLKLSSDTVLYLDRGAVLLCDGDPSEFTRDFHKASFNRDGTFFISTEPGAHDVAIRGRGTIDGNGQKFLKAKALLNHLVVPMNCQGFAMDGVVLRDSALWGTVIANSSHVTLTHTKHFNNLASGEDDCVDVCNSRDVLVKDCIAISLDDPYSTKTWAADTDIAKKWSGAFGINDNVRFEDCLAWTHCFAFKVGAGVWAGQQNISVHNGVVFDAAHAFGISHSYGGADVKNVSIDGLDVESTRSKCLGQSWLRIAIDCRDAKTTRGGISDISIQHVTVRDPGKEASLVEGRDAARMVQNVTFKDVRFAGRPDAAAGLADLGLSEPKFATGVVVHP